MSVLIWTQHLLGTGHLRRALAVAAALARRGVATVLASGGPPTRFACPPGVRFVQLDPVSAGADFRDLRDAAGRPWGEAGRTARREAFLALVQEVRPRVLVTELFPFGRRAFREELLPALDLVRSSGGRVVCSLRDVLAEKAQPEKSVAMRDLALACYDRILVHGDPAFLPLGTTFPHADELAPLLRYTGFVLDRPVRPAPVRRGILVSAGGGRVGGRLLEAAAVCRIDGALAREPWQLVGGAALKDAERARLAALRGRSGRVDAHLSDLPEQLAGCRVSVSQAGYNTVAEALMAAAPMVLVPYAAGGETEQRRRAARLVELGRAVLLDEAGLTPGQLALAIARAAEQDVAISQAWAFDGAAASAELILELLR
ncbi:glycosyltransferase family protein [Geminicoccus harenae]|uniref:glycosyltransferase family protein n=1 Tax=Geminicoccus harenae TaxID=2498453 RepID=UPI001C943E9D|nr:glycosyltransferase [Geminicoccus harenae]